MVDEPYKRWGRLDVLFNNAGVIRVEPMFDVTEAEWDRVMDTNLKGAFLIVRAAGRQMVKQEGHPSVDVVRVNDVVVVEHQHDLVVRDGTELIEQQCEDCFDRRGLR